MLIEHSSVIQKGMEKTKASTYIKEIPQKVATEIKVRTQISYSKTSKFEQRPCFSRNDVE